MMELFLCMILDINNGGSLIANCRHPYDEHQVINKVNLMVVGIEAPINNQPFAEESKQNLAKLCSNKEANVTVYMRNNQLIICEVECNGKDVATQQILTGMAKASVNYLDESTGNKLLKYQQKAQQQNIGIWSNHTN